MNKEKYIIVTTLCDREDAASKIQDTLLNEKMISGCQITKVKSKYWWNGEIEETEEYHLEMRTKKSLFKDIEKVIKETHDYEVCEISYHEIEGSQEFLDWIDRETK